MSLLMISGKISFLHPGVEVSRIQVITFHSLPHDNGLQIVLLAFTWEETEHKLAYIICLIECCLQVRCSAQCKSLRNFPQENYPCFRAGMNNFLCSVSYIWLILWWPIQVKKKKKLNEDIRWKYLSQLHYRRPYM